MEARAAAGDRGTRRRGPALEATILDAVWAELSEVGYARLTMEGVAARARTGKQVLYRRWANRAELVVAAMRHRGGSIADEIPDTGELRGDVLAVLRQTVHRHRDTGQDVIRGIMADLPDLHPEFFTVMSDVMTTILERAAARGEIPSARLPVRVVTLPTDLLRHELLLSRRPVTDETLTGIVDDVFLPVVRAPR
ncbi:TetR/AcrR family transcriptional regulator [Streptomyces sp. CA-111067]|uniref:TetR/AcrR family transcriptional regulator n=1 Tax=Streptomyces sp. CA-111067 TaxID=3240046 RepID=UPI003D98E987